MDGFDLVAQAGMWRLAGAVLQSLPLTALVWLLCRFVHRLGPGARCWLWWLVSLQLLAGLVWPTPVRLPLLPAQPATSQVVTQATVAARMDGMPTTDARLAWDAAQGQEQLAATAAAALPMATPGRAGVADAGPWPLRLLLLAWLAGVAAMATRSLRDLRATRRRLRACSDVVPADVLTRYQLLAARLGVRRAPPLRLCAQLDSPQLCGFWRPQLLLPATQLPRMSGEAIEMALHHELVHLQRGDLLWGWVPALAQHLFFFHPVAHLAAREYGLAREAACDAAVLASDRHAPQDYGRLLLQFGVAPRAVAVVAAASPNFILLKRRLTMLQSSTAPWRAGAFVLVAAVAALGVMPYRVVAAAPEADPARRANLAAAEPAEAAKAAEAVETSKAADAPAAAEAAHVAAAARPVASAAPAATVATAQRPAPAARAQPAAAPRAAAAAQPAPAATAAAATRASAAGQWMPPPPAPPAPPTPTAPMAPMTPMAPMAPMAPPVPPAPEPPLTPGAMRGTFSFVDKDDARNAWVLMEGDHVHAFGTPEDLRDARAQQQGKEALWWFRDGNQRYVVRDPATLSKLKQAYAPLQELGRQQGELGRGQGDLGRQQGELGARQGELGARQAEMAARVAQLALEQSNAELSGKPLTQERQRQLEREQQALSREMGALAAQQRALGMRQGDLGRRQGDLGKRQGLALSQLRAQGEQLAREAIASGKAQRL